MFIIERIKSYLILRSFRRKWRSLNNHNETTALNIFDLRAVSVGRQTYGMLNIRAWGGANEKITIGDFVSIADNVVFLLGGNHNIKGYLNYPLYSKYIEIKPELDAQSKGEIIISNDVWIGFGAMILSGVKLGRGCVVGAGSVVTKSFPDYAIVGGNPAKIIGYRLQDNEIEIASQLDLDLIERNIMTEEIIELLYEKPTANNFFKLKKLLIQ
ncbi:TPA: CatB-related O-acetyltransferase [Aeromonas hydrophila]